jgi:hypothetical protein
MLAAIGEYVAASSTDCATGLPTMSGEHTSSVLLREERKNVVGMTS